MSDRGYFVAKIRHEFTRYNRLSAYYAQFPDRRRKLNQIINLLLDGAISIDQFKERVKEVEASVDLTRKPTQREWIRMFSHKMRKSGRAPDQAKAIAKSHLQAVLKFQEAIDKGIIRKNHWEQFLIKQKPKKN